MSNGINELHFSHILGEIKPSTWKSFVINEDSFIYPNEWHHSKLYDKSDNKDGNMRHKVYKKDYYEVPYEREFFYPDDGRFGLGKNPICYLARDSATSFFETLNHFRDNDFTFSEYDDYISGKLTTNPNHFGFPLSRQILPETSILDLSHEKAPFLEHLRENYNIDSNDLYNNVIASKCKTGYPLTQVIAETAFRNEIDGILYKSVRQPSKHVIAGSECVVLFNRDSIKEFNANIE